MGPQAAILSIEATLPHLRAAQDFVRRHAASRGVPESLCPKIDLVVEELFMNIANHAHPKTREEMEIHCLPLEEDVGERPQFCLVFKDWGPPFNPLDPPPPSLEPDIELRPIGGLGIHMVTRMTDSLAYVREGDHNIVTACFRLPGRE
ncbi:MAG: ATP-binding protein [Desulfovibrionaceae bacterium]|nr:ATP-binding protein [Desulfovibrionaceae bacterium]